MRPNKDTRPYQAKMAVPCPEIVTLHGSKHAALLLVALILLSACGGGGGTTPTVAPNANATTPIVNVPSGNNAGGNTSGNASGNTAGSAADSNGNATQGSGAGQIANSDGYYPDANGRYPDSNGIYPDQNGNYPSLIQAGHYANSNGVARSFSTAGALDLSNAFFKPFGNGRSCASCHDAADGFSITPSTIQKRFESSQGLDPLFSLNDGAVSPNAAVATLNQRQLAFSLLLNKGLFRIGMKIPDNAEFELLRANDPYGFASAQELSLYRRPLPSANLKFLSHLMWDGRETASSTNSQDCLPQKNCFAALDFNLASQAHHATQGHAQAALGLTAQQQKEIVDFEKTLFTAQIYSKFAGFLDVAGAKGGPKFLSKVGFVFGSNDPIYGNLKTGALFNGEVMSNYSNWLNSTGTLSKTQHEARQSIARGEQIFNNRPFHTSFQGGIPNDFDLPLTATTCSSCHNTPQVGGASAPLAVSIFTSDGQLRTPDLPLYLLRHKVSGLIARTTDPGVAMQTGKWNDIGRFKVPNLRGLSARAPYFHNGSAATITDVVFYYERTFGLGLSAQEFDDLVAFLSAL